MDPSKTYPSHHPLSFFSFSLLLIPTRGTPHHFLLFPTFSHASPDYLTLTYLLSPHVTIFLSSFLSFLFHSSDLRRNSHRTCCCLTPAAFERLGWWVPLGPTQDQPLPLRSPKVPRHDGWSGLLKVAHLGPTVSKNGITQYSILGFNNWVFTTWIVAPP